MTNIPLYLHRLVAVFTSVGNKSLITEQLRLTRKIQTSEHGAEIALLPVTKALFAELMLIFVRYENFQETDKFLLQATAKVKE